MVMMDTEHIIKRQYAKWAPFYDRCWKGYTTSTLQRAYEVLNPTGDEKILDLACGTGSLEEIILKKHPYQHIVGFDITKEMLLVASKKSKVHPNVRFLCGSASKLPFAAESFDIVVCSNSFHYFREPTKVLAECHRVLNPDGRLIILDWCRNYFTCQLCDMFLKVFDPAYHNCYRFEELQGILEGENFQTRIGTMFQLRKFWGMMCFDAIKKKP
jgi:ubiquinone/menaquinone biosynthesis C-methylase UbiE